jgi:colanic acid/amylovoran biosynthesis glycosyltransferase
MRNNNFNILEVRDYYPSLNNPSSSPWVYNQVLSLQSMGYSPVVVSPTPINPLKLLFKKRYRLYDTPSKSIEVFKGTPVIRPPYIKIPNNQLVGTTIKNLSKCILRYGNFNGIKLIHAHFGQNGVASLPLKRKLNVPLVVSFYGYDSGRLSKVFKPYYRSLMDEGDCFLVLSNDMKKDLLALGFPEEKILIHHLGINVDQFTYSEPASPKFTLLTVARLDEVKGIHLIIEALRQLQYEHPELKEKIVYRVVGGGIFESKLKTLVNNYSMDDSVFFLNNLVLPNSREVVMDEMKGCDVFCLCSYTPKNGAKEGTPVVLMEAQACGKPCISTYHAGIPEVVLDGETGILVQEKSVQDIKRAIMTLYSSSETRKHFGLNAQNHITKNYNHNMQMESLVGIFRSLTTI